MVCIHIVSVHSLVIAHAAFAIFAISKSTLTYNYFKPVENHNGEKVNLPDSTSPLMKEIPSVISAANNDIESSMKESSPKTDFYKHMHKDGISMHTTLESWLGIQQKTMRFGISYRSLVGIGPLTLLWMLQVQIHYTRLCAICDQICQKGSYKRTVSSLIFHCHSTHTTMD